MKRFLRIFAFAAIVAFSFGCVHNILDIVFSSNPQAGAEDSIVVKTEFRNGTGTNGYLVFAALLPTDMDAANNAKLTMTTTNFQNHGFADVTDMDSIAMSNLLARELGLGVGISSGANFLASVKQNTVPGRKVATVFADDNKKYLSTPLAAPLHITDKMLSSRIELLGYEEHAVEVDVQHQIPLIVGHLVEHGIPGDAGVVDQNVHPAEGGDSGVHGGLDLLVLGHVALADQNVAADLGSGLLSQSLVVVEDGHAGGTLLDVALDNGGADALAAAGDDGVLAVQITHNKCLLLFF